MSGNKSLEKMDKFQETYKIPILSQKENRLYRPMTNKERESVIKNLPQRKAQDKMATRIN